MIADYFDPLIASVVCCTISRSRRRISNSKTLIVLARNQNLFSVIVTPALCEKDSTLQTQPLFSRKHSQKKTISSKYATAKWHFSVGRITYTVRQPVAGAFYISGDIRMNRYSPWRKVTEVFVFFFFSIPTR